MPTSATRRARAAGVALWFAAHSPLAPSPDAVAASGTPAAGTEAPAASRPALDQEPALLPRARPLTDRAFERSAARRERGRYLADAVIGCVLCHSERATNLPGAPPVAGREYAGAVFAEEPGYLLVAPNLTPDLATGAGAWSDDMLARAIREGVGHDGRAIGGPMWWWAFRALSDEDLASIVVYLRSLPAVANALPARLLSADLERERAEAAVPLIEPVPPPDLADPLARGAYLLQIADCMGCHTQWTGEARPGGFGGGNRIERGGGGAVSRNITPDPSGIGAWTEATFRAALRDGRGGLLHPTMPWAAYRGMRDDDLGALYAVLREVPPVRHFVDNLAPPTPCPACGGAHGLGSLNVPPAASLERQRAPLPADFGPLEPCAGRYELDDGYAIEVLVRDGALWAAEGGGEPTPLVHTGNATFLGLGLTAPIAFERDPATGRVGTLLSLELGPRRPTRWRRTGG